VFVVFELILADAARRYGAANVLVRDGIWAATILFPAGFSAPQPGAVRPGPTGSSFCFISARPPSLSACSRSGSAC
jgi:hypothetical protein